MIIASFASILVLYLISALAERSAVHLSWNDENGYITKKALLEKLRLKDPDFFRLHLGLNVDGEMYEMEFRPVKSGRFASRKLQRGKSGIVQGPRCMFESAEVVEQYSFISVCGKEEVAGLIRLAHRIYKFHHDKVLGFYVESIEEPILLRARRAPDPVINLGIDDWTNTNFTPPPSPSYYSQIVDNSTRYVEYFMCFSKEVSEAVNGDQNLLRKYGEVLIGLMNVIFAPLRIVIVLSKVEVWQEQNKVDFSSSKEGVLASLSDYYAQLLFRNEHYDYVQAFTANISSSEVGVALQGTMCSGSNAVAVVLFRTKEALISATTMAHELGHTLGARHDDDSVYGGICKCAVDKCIMQSNAYREPLPLYWSDCSLRTFSTFFKLEGDVCLHNVPKLSAKPATCGNGVVEGDEECDCGWPGVCRNPCCDASTCKMRAGSECASGRCCDLTTCKRQARGTVCRAQADSCDLAEFCDGLTSHCPGDFYVQDGLPCPDDKEERCFDGRCASRSKSCSLYWPGNHGDCPHDDVGDCGLKPDNWNETIPCEKEHAQCGRLFCKSSNENGSYGFLRTELRYTVSWNSSSGEKGECYAYAPRRPANYSLSHMVPSGARCGKPGEDKICLNQKCQLQSAALKGRIRPCNPPDCGGNGICNNMGNCHCNVGYGGAECTPGPEVSASGGSVNSGPMGGSSFTTSMLIVVGICGGAILLVGIGIAAFFCGRQSLAPDYDKTVRTRTHNTTTHGHHRRSHNKAKTVSKKSVTHGHNKTKKK